MEKKNQFPRPEKAPNIKTPAGMELYWNSNSGHWALRPISGYSAVYLTKRSFIPKSTEERQIENEVKTVTNKKNSNLHNAKRKKDDEFYTRLEDVTNELKHYKKFFEGKVVYCPCDKAFNCGRSNFFEFFASHFVDWGLKKLVATQYVEGGRGWKWVIERGDVNGNGRIDESEIDTYQLEGNGDFLSPECRKIMEESDIVSTNPPFSKELFRPFVKQIMDLGKDFLIIGSQNAITYKDIFTYIKEDKMWLGYTNPHDFEVPLKRVEDEKKQYELNGKIFQKFGNITWYTNLPHDKRKEDLGLGGTYAHHEKGYPKYDNYDAIEVSKVAKIPDDYYGAMGVPISFLSKHNPEQFEILGLFTEANGDCFIQGSEIYTDDKHQHSRCPVLNKKRLYPRILIRRKNG